MNLKFELNIDGVTKEIEEPIGWDTSELSIKRDMDRYHGLFFGYTTSLEFVGDGHAYLEEEFVKNGFEGSATLRISMDCEERGNYELVFEGELNFVTYNKKYSDYCSITMEVVSSAIEMKAVNRQELLVSMSENTSIDGNDISGNTMLDLVMHNYTLLFSGRWDSGVERTVTAPSTPPASLVGGTSYFWQLPNVLCKSFDEIGGMTDCYALNSGFVNVSGLINAVTLFDSAVFFTAPRTSTYTISFKLSGVFADVSNISISRGGSYVLTFDRNNSGTIVQIFEAVPTTAFSTSSAAYSTAFDSSGSFSFSMNAGEKVAFRWITSGYGSGSGGTPYNVTQTVTYDADNYITIGEVSTYPQTTAKASKIYDCFWKAISNATGGKDNFYSLFFGYPSAPDRAYIGNGCGSYTAISNGYLIRGFPIIDKPVFVNLKDLFDSADAIFNIGLGFEQQTDGVVRCRVEDKGYFYSDSTLLAIFDDVNEIKVSVLEDICYNAFELGFQDYKVEQGTEKLNTNNEFLSQYSWKTTAKNTKNKFDKKSKYIGSLYPIEYTRRNRFVSAGTKESKFDQDNFILAMNRNGSLECEKDERFDNVTGIDSASEAYNLRFNLFSTLVRWSNILNSNVSRLDDKTIYFQYAALNSDLQARYSNEETCVEDYNGQGFSVSQNLAVDDINNPNGQPIYEPFMYEFDYPMSWAEYKLFRQYPQGTIIFGRDGNLTQGFIYEVTYKPTQGLANYKILRSYVQNVNDFFPKFPQQSDFEIMGVITEYYGTMSIWDSTGKGTGQYSKWALCNGNNNTPDLRGRFIVSYDERDSDYNALGKTGGSKTHTLTAEQSGMPAHSVTPQAGGNGFLVNRGAGNQQINTSNGGNIDWAVEGSVSVAKQDAAQSFDKRPNYYALAKIMYIG